MIWNLCRKNLVSIIDGLTKISNELGGNGKVTKAKKTVMDAMNFAVNSGINRENKKYPEWVVESMATELNKDFIRPVVELSKYILTVYNAACIYVENSLNVYEKIW